LLSRELAGVRGYAGGKTWPGVRLIAAVARRGKGSGNPRFGVFLEQEMSAKIEGGEGFSRALSAGLWLLPPRILFFFLSPKLLGRPGRWSLLCNLGMKTVWKIL